MHVAVIGAGAAGLACARHLTDPTQGHTCTVFEQTADIGGTWVYTDNVGLDEFGYPVHTSMYKSLRTNLPKEIMGFLDFPVVSGGKSYIPANEILKFLNSYADHFKLREHIQFHQHVNHVTPINDGWQVTVVDVRSKEESSLNFDAVMVCNGHYWKPNIPSIDGSDVFQGEQIHSHNYRTPEIFRGKRVLVVGAGPSGMDLTLEISIVAEQVIMSHHYKEPILTAFPTNVLQKSDVVSLKEKTAIFKDASEFPVDIVLYCTGFFYSFPFLDEECHVRVEKNHVQPLYKHMIHVEHNTLCFIGLPFYVCAFMLFDLQAQFFMRILSRKVRLPSKEDMIADSESDFARRQKAGLGHHQAHMMGPMQGEYYDELADAAGLPRVPPVMARLHNESSQRFLDDLVHYRNDVYQILDDETYIQI